MLKSPLAAIKTGIQLPLVHWCGVEKKHHWIERNARTMPGSYVKGRVVYDITCSHTHRSLDCITNSWDLHDSLGRCPPTVFGKPRALHQFLHLETV